MSEIQILSNSSSSLYASSLAGQGPDRSEYVYSMDRSTVNKHNSRLNEVRFNNPKFGTDQSVEIPSFGVLNKMVLRIKIKIKGDLASKPYAKELYSRIIDEVAIMNSSRRVFTLPGPMISYLVQSLPEDEREKWLLAGMDEKLYDDEGNEIARNGNYQADERACTIYVPLFFPCFKEGGAHAAYMSNFNTRFIEKTTLFVKLNQASALGENFVDGTEVELTAMDLLCDFHIIEQKELNKIEEANYSLSQNLAQVMSDFSVMKSTPQPYSNLGEGIKLQMFNTQLVHSIIIGLTSTLPMPAAASGNIQANAEGAGDNDHCRVPIKKIKLTSAGRVLYETNSQIESLLLGSQDSYMGYHAKGMKVNRALKNRWKLNTHAVAEGDVAGDVTIGSIQNANYLPAAANGNWDKTSWYVITFANNSCDTSKIAGCSAFKNLNSVQLEVEPQDGPGLATSSGDAVDVGAGGQVNFTFPNATQVQYTLTAYVRYYQAIATSAQSGRISISLSQ